MASMYGVEANKPSSRIRDGPVVDNNQDEYCATYPTSIMAP